MHSRLTGRLPVLRRVSPKASDTVSIRKVRTSPWRKSSGEVRAPPVPLLATSWDIFSSDLGTLTAPLKPMSTQAT